METEIIERDPSVELVKLIRFLADPEGVPADQRKFEFRHDELSQTIRSLLIPTGRTTNYLRWKVDGPTELSIEDPPPTRPAAGFFFCRLRRTVPRALEATDVT